MSLWADYNCERFVCSEVVGSSAVKFVSVTHALTSNQQLVTVLTAYVHLTNRARRTSNEVTLQNTRTNSDNLDASHISEYCRPTLYNAELLRPLYTAELSVKLMF